MTLPPRCRLSVAPRFHLEADWAGRLTVGAGVSEADGRFFSRGPWRPLTADELTLFTSGRECGPAEGGALPRLWAVVNLGDEDPRLVLIPVPIQALAAELALRHPGRPLPATVGELVGRFLRESPDCAPIRLRLGPGEGFRLPSGGLI